MNTKLQLIICLLAGLSFSYCSREPQPEAAIDSPSLFDQFQQQELVHIRLALDLDEVLAAGSEESNEFQTGRFTWTDAAGREHAHDVRVRMRGVSRRRICSFPPLKLKFAKDDMKAAGLAPYNDLKLVTHCIDDESLVLKEYLGYQVFRTLTDQSFRAQLARVSYIDKSTGEPITEKYGFLIEDDKQLAARLGAEVIDAPKELNVIDARQYQLLTVFQYMIGNTDWSLANSHNILLLRTPRSEAPTMVPYDFDLCGMVNAPYAVPHPMLPIDNVRERLFQWRSKNREGLDETLAFFNQHREEILQTCRDFKWLDESARQDITTYLDSFFQIINDPVQRAEKLLTSGE